MIRSLIIGDFSMSSPFGLVISKGATRSASSMKNLTAQTTTLQPCNGGYTSGVFRGVAMESVLDVQHARFRIEAFVSERTLDAHVSSSGEITSIDWSGSPLAVPKEKNHAMCRECGAGGRIAVEEGQWLRVGMTAFNGQLDREVVPVSGFGFTGRHVSVIGSDVMIVAPRIQLTCEAATSGGGAWSMVGAVVAHPASASSACLSPGLHNSGSLQCSPSANMQIL